MRWSPPSALVDWCQIVSAGFSFLALALALYAIWKSSRDIARERRTVHELVVLRDLTEVIEQHGSAVIPRIRSCLFLLKGSADLPMVRAAVDARPAQAAVRAFERQYRGAPALDEPTKATQQARSSRYARFRLTRDDGTASDELDQAIQRRLAG
jgi:hypothetical protein